MKIITLLLYMLGNLDLDKKNSMRLVEINKPQGKTVSMYTIDDISLPSIRNLSREILYEGFVSLDSVLFLLETKTLTQSNLDNFLNETILKAKNMLLIDSSVFDYFENFSTKVDCKDKKIKSLIEKRNKTFDNDKSQIALILTKNKIESLKRRITTNLLLYDDKKEGEYIRMVQDLANSRYGDDGVSVNLAKERFEFYRESVNLSQTQIDEAKISLNLGGSIFSPSLLFQLTKKITIADKRDKVKKLLTAILEPTVLLRKNIINRSFMDKKKSIIEFLINCLEIRSGQYKESIDNAFYQRSLLIEQYLKERKNSENVYKVLDRLQEEEIKRLIYIFENIKENQLGFCLLNESELILRYLNYLCDNQESSKKKLLRLFYNKKL